MSGLYRKDVLFQMARLKEKLGRKRSCNYGEEQFFLTTHPGKANMPLQVKVLMTTPSNSSHPKVSLKPGRVKKLSGTVKPPTINTI